MAIHIRRREFITLVGGTAAAWPLAARAQPERMRRVGVLMGIESDPDARARVAAFRQELRQLGWSEDRDIRIDVIWGAGDADHVRTDAAELIGKSPDVILANGPVPTTELQKATRTIPIVFTQVPDPVDLGIIASLARPGMNITGFTHFELAFGGKWLEVLKEIAPAMRRVGLISLAGHPALPGFQRTITAAAMSSGLEVSTAAVRNAAAEVEGAVENLAREPNGGLIVLPSPIAPLYRDLIIALAVRYRLPAIYPFRYFPTYGGLMSYGIDTIDVNRRAASYVDRILKGEKPSDLPVQAPTKFELVINLKTAKALGLAVPATLLATADEIIE
jgi:putative tryptophan/tyrosine transport system substrate-binding protein